MMTSFIGSATKPKSSGSKSVDHRWQRAPTSEVARLQEELKNTKNQLSESESQTKQARQEAEQARHELVAMTAKFNDLWACEESRIQELRKVSQDRDRAWESELQAVQKHLATAITENQKLNARLQKAAESEAAQAEVLTLKTKLSQTNNTVEELKMRLNESKEAESQALEQLAGRVEEVGAVLAAKVAVEGELKRLKVQMEQWKKAAEVAAAMVLGEVAGGGELFDVNVTVTGERLNSGYLEDAEDESSIKKTNNNVLKKLGVLLRKGQK
ncbi:hypothetical protein E3N88_16286 [Mikania micrantha]|uniref:Uncharacterized protein n=1 Tax=Mikania micrantha TaxID=192012 RepID=A0A5N6P0L6_9ASTR|nr:hypothetical protein E3N88_16286 [Mikania micrantha]